MDSAEIQPQRGYFWLEVEARRLDLETVTIKLLQTEKELARVPWTVADRFDPAFIWRSYYPNAGSGGGPIVCPPAEETQIPGQFVTVRGYLLINAALSGVVDEVAKLHSVGVDTPKWPKELGLA